MTLSNTVRVALVTGAARNIGAATAQTLAAKGFDVVIHTRRDQEGADEVASVVRGLGRRAEVILADLEDPQQVQELADKAGAVDVLVNNASYRPHRPFLDTTFDEWRKVYAVTVDAPFLLCQQLLPHMIEQKWGRIINMVGVRAQQGAAGRSSSGSAKNAMMGLTRVLANEVGESGVTVNAVSPGTIVTDRDIRDSARLDQRQKIGALGRFGAPADVASLVAFLASDDAGYLTGQVVGINGGEWMH